jgi:hypothetical protein
MLPRLLALLTGFFLYTSFALGQAYEPGLLVTSRGDTLRGEIENAFWVEPPTFVRFRATPESSSQLFQPRQLRAVSFTGGRYFRYEALPIDYAASNQLSDVLGNPRPDVRTDSVLAEVLLEGPVMLWRVVRPNSAHYLLRRPGQPTLDLCERKFIRELPSGARQIVDGNNFSGRLKIYFGDCPLAIAAAQSAAFTATGIGSVVVAYYTSCQPVNAPFRSWLEHEKPRKKMALEGGLLAGIRYNYFKNYTPTLPETQPCTDCQARPFVGIYADLWQPSRNKSFYGELSLSTFSNQYWGYFQTNSQVAYYVVNYRAWLASARLGLRFFFPLPHEQQWLFSVSYELNKTIRPVVTSATGNIRDVPSNQLGYGTPTLLPNIGLGWRARRLTLSLDGQLYSSPSSEGFFGHLVGSNFATRFGIGYRLGGNPDAAKPAGAK